MKVLFLNSFKKDIKKIKDKNLKAKIKKVIINLEKANSLRDIENIKSLSGFSLAYRIRIGNYRLGMFCYDEVVELSRFLKRNDIYKVFP